MLGHETALLSDALLKTTVYALWYSALFWLPVRGLCEMIDRRRRGRHPHAVQQRAYRVGMNVLPPM